MVDLLSRPPDTSATSSTRGGTDSRTTSRPRVISRDIESGRTESSATGGLGSISHDESSLFDPAFLENIDEDAVSYGLKYFLLLFGHLLSHNACSLSRS